MAEGQPALELRAVTKQFDGFAALSEVDLQVAPSEIVCIVGPSGCGKSTLLNIMAGFEPASGGEVLVKGRPVNRPGPDRTVVFQSDALFPWLTVQDNVVAGARARRQPDYAARARELIGQVKLTGFEDRYPYQLSGGMRQRASIARALMSELEVLLMDEPFGALDAQTRSQMQALLQEIWTTYQATIVFITHDIEEALLLGDRVVVMAANPGRVIEQIEVSLPRPRGIELTTSTEFNEMKAHILRLLHPEVYVSV